MDLCFRENLLLAKGYRPVDREQEFLLPPNMIDWLDADHLACFVIDTVAALDTAGLHPRAALRRDAQPVRSAAGPAGPAGYDPDMLLTLLIYGYACGERSSRRLERLCTTDVAFRLISAGDIPDHAVIARFRQIHEQVERLQNRHDLLPPLHRKTLAAGHLLWITGEISGCQQGDHWPSPGRRMAAYGEFGLAAINPASLTARDRHTSPDS